METTLYNRPGLSVLAYRIGTHAGFLQGMLARLPSQVISDGPTLAALTTRASDDLAIALLDAWATVADVLTFYQERIANEGFLRTATERRSVLELARAIGYELNPGVAASTYLAFTVEDAEGAPPKATVDPGVKVLSIPGQDQRPQTFETVERIEARAEWNQLRPRQTSPQEVQIGTDVLYLKGVDNQLQPGDAILIVGDERQEDHGSERWDLRILQAVDTFPAQDYTRVAWQEALGHKSPTVEPADNPRAFAFRLRASLFGNNAPDWRSMPGSIKNSYDPGGRQRTQWPGFEIQTVAERIIDLDAAYPPVLEGSWIALSKPDYVELYRAETVTTDSRTDFTLISKTTRIQLDSGEHLNWFGLRQTVVYAHSDELELAEEPVTAPIYGTNIVLDGMIEDLEPGQKIVVSGKPVEHVEVAATAKVIRIGRRESTRPAQALVMTSGDVPSHTKTLTECQFLEIMAPPLPMADGRVQWHLRDAEGFSGLVTAKPNDLAPRPSAEDAETLSEVAFIERLNTDDGKRTVLILSIPLNNTYDRKTVTINANVAAATHGETVQEALGSGDGARTNQRFQLRTPPLTYVSAPTASGGDSTLAVRVNDVEWKEVGSLLGGGERDQSYIVRTDDDGKSHVIFGDGHSGARLPSGTENVMGTYRSGIGPDGEVRAGSLALMQTRPHGIREVTNPLAATGAAAPEVLEDARANAPLTVLTLDRIVSLQDFEDFARAFAGIGKAQAVVLWNGQTRLVHITVASAQGDRIDSSSSLYRNLTTAIDLVRDPVQEVSVDSYTRRHFKIEAGLKIDSRYIDEEVRATVRAGLEEAFSFKKRSLGQAVTATEIVALIQDVAGVVATDLNQLYLVDEQTNGGEELLNATFNSVLRAATTHRRGKDIQPAQLLLLAREGVSFSES